MSRKAALITKLIFLIAILIFFISVALNWTLGGNFFFFSFRLGTQVTSVEGAESTQEEQSFAGVKEIELNLVELDVEVVEADVDEVIVYDRSEPKRSLFGDSNDNIIAYENGKLYFEEGQYHWRWFGVGDWSGGRTGDILIEVPKGSTLAYTINSTSGEVLFDAASDGELTIHNVAGESIVKQGGEELSIESVSGDCFVYAPFEKVSSDNISGDLYLVADRTTTSVKGETVSGDIQLELTEKVFYEVKLESLSGKITDRYEYDSDDEDLEISLSSISGDVLLEDWS